MVHACFNEVISNANYYVDLHGCDLTELSPPHVIMHRIGQKHIDETVEKMARAYGLRDICVLVRGQGAAPSGSGGRGFVPPTSGTSNYAALDKGIPCVTAEAGRPGACAEEDVMIHVNGVTNVMKTLDLLQGELSPIPTNQRILDKGQTFIQVTKPGIFTTTLKAGDLFAKGNLVGYVRDIFGETLEELVSPVDGMVWTLLSKMSVDAGDIVYRVLLT